MDKGKLLTVHDVNVGDTVMDKYGDEWVVTGIVSIDSKGSSAILFLICPGDEGEVGQEELCNVELIKEWDGRHKKEVRSPFFQASILDDVQRTSYEDYSPNFLKQRYE